MEVIEGGNVCVVNGVGEPGTDHSEKPRKTPRRILHFSDGVLEEYSTDEEETDNGKQNTSVDTKRMHWPQYMLYMLTVAGTKTLKACDYMGEGLANFFGITTPKYQYEIDEYHRILKEKEEAAKKEDVEMSGWNDSQPNAVVNSEPLSAGDSSTVSQERY